MVKDHSDSEKENPLLPHMLFFPINSKGFFYMHHPTDRIAHTTAFVTPVVPKLLLLLLLLWECFFFIFFIFFITIIIYIFK